MPLEKIAAIAVNAITLTSFLVNTGIHTHVLPRFGLVIISHRLQRERFHRKLNGIFTITIWYINYKCI